MNRGITFSRCWRGPNWLKGRTMIAGGFRYTVLRTGGWPGAPTIQTFAIDRAGNEAS